MTIEVTPVDASAPAETATPAASTAPDPAPSAPAPPDAAKVDDAKVDDAPPKDTKVAARFAELARREAEHARRQQALKAEEAELTAYKQAREQAKKDPRAALKALGISLQELVDAELKDGQPETVEDRVARLERERKEEAEARKKGEEEQTKAQIAATIDRAKAGARSHVDADPERYELIIAEGAHDEVFATIEGMYAATAKEVAEGKRATPLLLSFEQAADMVEEALLERARRLTSSKKLSAPAAPPPAATPPAPAKKASPTITAAKVAAPAATPPAPAAGLSRKERVALAAAKLRFKEG